jgi:hypothetical protein
VPRRKQPKREESAHRTGTRRPGSKGPREDQPNADKVLLRRLKSGKFASAKGKKALADINRGKKEK